MNWKTIPVKSRVTIDRIIEWFEQKYSQRDALLFRFGINVGLRVKDILSIRYDQIYTSDGAFREHLIIKEGKTGRNKAVLLNRNIRKHLNIYIADRPALRRENGYIFYSSRNPDRPVHVTQVWRNFKNVEYAMALDNFAPHSMRKTFAWHLFKATGDIRTVQQALGHVDPKTTMLYIGLDQIEVDDACRKLSLG